jgi:hypothetical protein
MKYIKGLLLPVIVISYALLYLATTKVVPCDTYCEKLFRIDTTLTKNRNYIWYIGTCVSGKPTNDTLCVMVSDTIGIDWNRLADTTCQIASQVGLPGQQIIIMRTGVSPPDTLAKKQCP